jgi:hypothetical protein
LIEGPTLQDGALSLAWRAINDFLISRRQTRTSKASAYQSQWGGDPIHRSRDRLHAWKRAGDRCAGTRATAPSARPPPNRGTSKRWSASARAAQGQRDSFDDIEMFYNPKRRHSFTNDISAVDYEKQCFRRLSRAWKRGRDAVREST